MNWFRSNIRSCAWLALLALALQAAVSFGHIHRDDLGLPPAPVAQAQFALRTALASVDSTDRDRHPAPDDYCPICASIALLATGVTALPPVLVAPALNHRVGQVETRVEFVSAQAAFSFRARAPPVA
jgi:hypothetical protein